MNIIAWSSCPVFSLNKSTIFSFFRDCMIQKKRKEKVHFLKVKNISSNVNMYKGYANILHSLSKFQISPSYNTKQPHKNEAKVVRQFIRPQTESSYGSYIQFWFFLKQQEQFTIVAINLQWKSLPIMGQWYLNLRPILLEYSNKNVSLEQK